MLQILLIRRVWLEIHITNSLKTENLAEVHPSWLQYTENK